VKNTKGGGAVCNKKTSFGFRRGESKRGERYDSPGGKKKKQNMGRKGGPAGTRKNLIWGGTWKPSWTDSLAKKRPAGLRLYGGKTS